MPEAQKKNRLGLAPEAARFKGLRRERLQKQYIILAEKRKPNFAGEGGAFSVSGMELVFTVIGISWCVGRLFRLVERIDGK